MRKRKDHVVARTTDAILRWVFWNAYCELVCGNQNKRVFAGMIDLACTPIKILDQRFDR